jgi:hypothetical protein
MKNKVRGKKNWLLVLVAGLFCQVCTYRNLEEIRPEIRCNEDLPDTVSFSRDIQPILAQNCSKAGCHSGIQPKGNFNLEASVAYNQLLESGSGYVDTITPKYSVVYSSLVSKSEPMPPTGKLSQCDIDLIEKWMEQDAKNN